MRSNCLFSLALIGVIGCGRYARNQSSAMHGDGGAGDLAAGASGSDGGVSGAASAGGSNNAGDAGMGAVAQGGESSVGLVILPSVVPNARLNASYLVTFSAQGGEPAYAFELVGGTLPRGLTIGKDGTLSGVPRELGAFSFEIQVTDAANKVGKASYQLEVSRTRWLVTSAGRPHPSTEGVLYFFDLQHPDAAPATIAAVSPSNVGFSPDGKWDLYASHRDQALYDYYLVNVAGDQPSKPVLLGTHEFLRGCQWSPDSSKLACLRNTDPADARTAELAVFDTSQSVPGPAQALEKLPARDPEASAGSERALAFLDDSTLVYSHGASDFSRVEWRDGIPGQPEARGLNVQGVSGGVVLKLSPNGERALVRRYDGTSSPGAALVDFRNARVTLLDQPTFQISDDFEVGFAGVAASLENYETGYFYYSVNGIDVQLVGQQTQAIADVPQFAGHTVVRKIDRRVELVTIGAAGIVEQVVAGDYQGASTLPYRYSFDPSASWLFINSVSVDAQGQADWTTSKHWLSHLDANGPAPAQVVAQGFYAEGARFSPDDRSCVLPGYDISQKSPQKTAVPFVLLQLDDPSGIKTASLDLPLYWSDVSWSPDSTYLAFIGGDPSAQSRREYLVDVLAPTQPPRKLLECSSSSASDLPTCAGSVTFQP